MKQAHAPCSSCLRTTKHNILYEITETDDDHHEAYAMLQCAGCGSVSLANQTLFYDDGSITNRYYPSPVSRKRPSWWLEFGMAEKDEPMSDLLNEVYQSVDGGQHRLAAMGIRALIEQLMISKVGDQGSFEKNLDALQSHGFISTLQFDSIRKVLDLGHGAMHRGFKPDDNELSLALDIVEATIGTIYHHAMEAEKLTTRVPPRARKQDKEDKL